MENSFESKLVEVLFRDGIVAEPITTVKNGIACMGIRVIDPDNPIISPIVYYSSDETIETIASRISALQNVDKPDIHIDDFTNPDYVTEHVYMAIQRISDDDNGVIKRPLLNLELVLRISLQLGDSTGSIKVNQVLLEQSGIEEDALWQIAKDRMRNCFEVKSMAETLGLPDEFAPNVPFYVCTTDEKTNGAVALAYPDLFWNFCVHKDTDGCWIIPSSTEELLLVPFGAIDVKPEFLASMVSDVNGTSGVVDPLIQLEPVAYRYDMETDRITIAASAENGGAE